MTNFTAIFENSDYIKKDQIGIEAVKLSGENYQEALEDALAYHDSGMYGRILDIYLNKDIPYILTDIKLGGVWSIPGLMQHEDYPLDCDQD